MEEHPKIYAAAIDQLTRPINTHKKGLPDWMKNAREIRVIDKLRNRSHYDYSDSDVKKIVQTLSSEVDLLKTRLSAKGGKAGVEFKL